MRYAVIKTGGKQYRVAEGEILEVEKINAQPKERIEFPEVLLVAGNGSIFLGQPYVPGSKVTGEILEQVKGPKIRVAKFKAKVRYRRVRGHRQSLTRVKIEKIITAEEKSVKVEEATQKLKRPRTPNK